MVDLISAAYGLDASNVQGGPSWLEWDRFDVIAKVPSTTTPEMAGLMLRSLLADRFKLAVHTGSKPMQAFVLSTGTDKPKLKESDGTGNAGCQSQPPQQNLPPGTISYIAFSCHNTSMETLAHNLHDWAGGYLTSPVVDATGLKGSWDFDLKWTGKGQIAKAGADGISIFDAVGKQLGLKLELQTASQPVLIVDSVDRKPTANPPDLEKNLPAPPPAQFEVAVIKPSKPEEKAYGKISGDQVDMRGLTLKILIATAWDLDQNDDEELVGAPKWLDSDRFDVLAKVPIDALGLSVPNSPPIDEQVWRRMLRAILMDRFKMQVHTEDRPVTAYTLMAVNPKLRKADALSRTRCAEGPGPDGKDPRIANPVLNKLISCQNMTMVQIGDELQHIAEGYIYSPVLDATGIAGSWDFTLSFSSSNLIKGGGVMSGGLPAGDANTAQEPNGAISLFDAVSKQLGLKLEKQKRPEPVLVIDHIEEMPTEN